MDFCYPPNISNSSPPVLANLALFGNRPTHVLSFFSQGDYLEIKFSDWPLDRRKKRMISRHLGTGTQRGKLWKLKVEISGMYLQVLGHPGIPEASPNYKRWWYPLKLLKLGAESQRPAHNTKGSGIFCLSKQKLSHSLSLDFWFPVPRQNKFLLFKVTVVLVIWYSNPRQWTHSGNKQKGTNSQNEHILSLRPTKKALGSLLGLFLFRAVSDQPRGKQLNLKIDKGF